ncbi:MAG: orotate phosphoribosyltransferase, partial [Chitinophagales bacterium]
LRNAGVEVIGMAALFTYDFDIAAQAFAEADCKLYTIGDYPSLINYAIQNNIIGAETETTLNAWRQNPSQWMQD